MHCSGRTTVGSSSDQSCHLWWICLRAWCPFRGDRYGPSTFSRGLLEKLGGGACMNKASMISSIIDSIDSIDLIRSIPKHTYASIRSIRISFNQSISNFAYQVVDDNPPVQCKTMREVSDYFGYKFSFAYRMSSSHWLTNYYETKHPMKYDERTGLYKSDGQPKLVRRLHHLGETPEVREIPRPELTPDTELPDQSLEFIKCLVLDASRWPPKNEYLNTNANIWLYRAHYSWLMEHTRNPSLERYHYQFISEEDDKNKEHEKHLWRRNHKWPCGWEGLLFNKDWIPKMELRALPGRLHFYNSLRLLLMKFIQSVQIIAWSRI